MIDGERPTWLGHPRWQGIGVLVAIILGVATLIVTWHPWGSHKPPPIPDQVRQIERQERKARGGTLVNLQRSLGLHGDGTKSWVFVFAGQKTWRVVVYDNESDRLRERIEVTNRVQPRKVPADFSYNKTRYRLLSPAQQRKARREWLLLYSPRFVSVTASALRIADGSSVLLVPMTAITAVGPDPYNSLRSTLVAVFWSADDEKYVVRTLYPLRERWTVPGPTDLRLELRPGAGFHPLPTAAEIEIDKRARIVYALVGGALVQVHAFRLPLSPDDLEECPVLWQGPAPIGRHKDVPRLEHELSADCAHI